MKDPVNEVRAITVSIVIFIGMAAVIFLSGKQLSIVADQIGKATGLGGAFIGVLLIPLVTTLPELSVSLSALALNAPNLALGNLFGSNLLNLSLIFFMDLAQGKGPIAKKLSLDHILTVSMLTMILTLALTGLVGKEFFTIGHLGGSTLVMVLIYFISHTLHYRYHNRNHQLSETPVSSSESQPASNQFTPSASVFKLIAKFAGLGVVIVLAARFLARAANTMTVETGLTEGLVGVLLLALSTSLPELVLTISAVRKGFFDQAFGSILGANILNMGLVFILDILYFEGPILNLGDQEIFLAAVTGILMTCVTAAGIVYRSKRSYFYLGIDAMVVIALYVVFLISVIDLL